MNIKKQLIQTGFRLHRPLVWVAFAALALFTVSGFLHVLLTWTGPQAAAFRAPQQSFSAAQVQAVAPILQQQGIAEAQVVKLVPSAEGPLLQVTMDALTPRRYFDPASGAELTDYDEQLARWLAGHYLQDAHAEITEVVLLTDYDSEYPWVNRLLPVYRLRMAGEQGLTLFIHTETLALANISNDWKSGVQRLFRQLHTFAWLDDARHLRVVLMALLLCCLIAMISSGLALLYTIKRKGKMTLARRGHRALAHVVAIPLLAFAASGFYHLLHSEYFVPQRDFNIAQPLPLAQGFELNPATIDLPDQPLHGVNLLAVQGRLYFRASLAPAPKGGGEHDHHGGRQQRFDGITREHGSYYFPATEHAPQLGSGTAMTDEEAARQLAMEYLNLSPEQVLSVEKITRFGPGYDFRNKRLPVWMVSVDHRPWDRLFIDVASGLLVDRNTPSARAEGYSFSFLHKWNFLTTPLGRENRDVLLALILGLSLALALLGMRMRLGRR